MVSLTLLKMLNHEILMIEFMEFHFQRGTKLG